MKNNLNFCQVSSFKKLKKINCFSKVLVEPEMTCLTEDDQKNEAFSTRIGRSFTFQKRSDQESEIRRARGAAAASGPPLGIFKVFERESRR